MKSKLSKMSTLLYHIRAMAAWHQTLFWKEHHSVPICQILCLYYKIRRRKVHLRLSKLLTSEGKFSKTLILNLYSEWYRFAKFHISITKRMIVPKWAGALFSPPTSLFKQDTQKTKRDVILWYRLLDWWYWCNTETR